MINTFQKAICRKIASAFHLAGKQGLPVLLFVDKWFSSRVFHGLIGDDFYDIAQSPLYQLNSFFLEWPDFLQLKNTENGYEELLYWAGYTITYWLYQENIAWDTLKQKYDYVLLLKNYDYLHTLSTESAIALAQEEYNRTLLAKIEVFNKRD